jgi:hypothetical protein
MKIFLDFDGVLRRESSPNSRLDSDCVRNFESAVLSHPEARVVITSSWRLVQPLDALRSLFSKELSARVEGATPDFPEVEGHPRHAEIQAYLAVHAARGTRWIAIDDDAEQYQRGAPLILVSAETGFDETCAQRLRNWLAYGH